jgi:excinuclease ABC subunit B
MKSDEPTEETSPEDVAGVIAELEEEMQEAAAKLEFERAALLRDQIDALKSGKFSKIAKKRARPKAKAMRGKDASAPVFYNSKRK